ncbi:MAG TPA: hypothetical protein VN033_03400 [Vulgatibacter sp.]|nr:hypothetical protein [Vulgatibacter sp.]
MAAKEQKVAADGPGARMHERFAAGDVRGARRLAVEAGAEGERLRALTDVDPVALWIGAFAIVLGLVYVGAFLL